jgi:hypothetical protein
MTKITRQFDLVRPVDDSDANAVAKANSVYGIVRLSIARTLDNVTVDYDASRLSEKDVEASLIGVGLPIRRDTI